MLVALMETMSSGCPVVATNITGNPDMIKSGKNGFLIKTESSKAITKAVLKILSDYDLRDKFVKEARLTIKQKYNWKIIVNRFNKLFKELI